LSGGQARLGEVILRGAALVTSAAQETNEVNPFRLLLRDSAASAERSTGGGGPAAGILSLSREEKVIGAVSIADTHGAETATREGLPLVLLDERTPGAQSTGFPMIHSAEARAEALARKALELGVRRFAILGPDNASGKRLAAIYKRTIERGGGAVTGHLTYETTRTSFTGEIANLRKIPFEGLFIPDDANRLELIAPALAAGDIWPRSPRSVSNSARELASSAQGRREALISTTALGLSSKFFRTSGRYVQGALLCPGFYPTDDPRNGSFLTKFRAIYGTIPSATDAYGYDAAMALRIAVERGAKTRQDVVRILAGQTFEGLTGTVRFGADHSRIDPPLIYVVEGEDVRLLK
jgi:ABC-type branched-subunit amino acid transport system substrate-binding protein